VSAGKRKALGRGLSALIPEPEGDERRAPAAAGEVPLDALEPNPYQPRLSIDPARLAELAASIRASGVVQPILVRRAGARYQIIAGERRWRAAQAAGLASVPVSVREVRDDQLLELALVENVQRQELTALEEAQAFQRLAGELGLSQEEIARRVGRDRTTIANTLRLLKLPRELRELLSQGRLDAGHARALLSLERVEDQLALGREAARRGLSVREVERRAALARSPRERTAARKEPNTAAAEERLRRALGTRVVIARRGKGGAIRVPFKTEAELQRLFELLLRAGRSR
jgi:ParB family transcriptional regulator, chromosome partitioning protein